MSLKILRIGWRKKSTKLQFKGRDTWQKTMSPSRMIDEIHEPQLFHERENYAFLFSKSITSNCMMSGEVSKNKLEISGRRTK